MKRLILALALCANPVIADQIDAGDIAALPPVDVWFLGETHDNPWHHETQASLVAAIKPGAIVFEMLTAVQVANLDEALAENPDLMADKVAIEAVLGWNQSGWPDFDMYYPIFRAAGDARIYGAQVSRADVRAAFKGGDVATIFGEGAADFGLLEALPPEQQAEREAKQLEAHCNALPEEMLPAMVMGQRLRDARLAQMVEQAGLDGREPIVVITGNGHARTDWGAPALVTDVLSKRSIAQFEQVPDGDVPFDFWVKTPEAEREDPCAAFGKS